LQVIILALAPIRINILLQDSGEKLPINKDASYDLVGATAEASEQSASQNLYGSLHNRLHRMIARIPDPNGTLMVCK
jgi:hypothetical protein